MRKKCYKRNMRKEFYMRRNMRDDCNMRRSVA